MKQKELLEYARKQSERISERYGVNLPEVMPSDVPAALQPLVPHANILGVGDDPVRGEIVEAVGSEYLQWVNSLVHESRAALRAWLATEPKDTPDVGHYAAFDWMLRAIDYVLAFQPP